MNERCSRSRRNINIIWLLTSGHFESQPRRGERREGHSSATMISHLKWTPKEPREHRPSIHWMHPKKYHRWDATVNFDREPYAVRTLRLKEEHFKSRPTNTRPSRQRRSYKHQVLYVDKQRPQTTPKTHLWQVTASHPKFRIWCGLSRRRPKPPAPSSGSRATVSS